MRRCCRLRRLAAPRSRSAPRLAPCPAPYWVPYLARCLDRGDHWAAQARSLGPPPLFRPPKTGSFLSLISLMPLRSWPALTSGTFADRLRDAGQPRTRRERWLRDGRSAPEELGPNPEEPPWPPQKRYAPAPEKPPKAKTKEGKAPRDWASTETARGSAGWPKERHRKEPALRWWPERRSRMYGAPGPNGSPSRCCSAAKPPARPRRS